MTSRPKAIAFDTEAILAFFGGEDGARTVRDYLVTVANGTTTGYLNDVNAAEIWYILKRRAGRTKADEHMAWLRSEAALRPVSSDDTWLHAATIKADHRLSLRDAFAIATGRAKDCPVLAGNDPELDAAAGLGVTIIRIRK